MSLYDIIKFIYDFIFQYYLNHKVIHHIQFKTKDELILAIKEFDNDKKNAFEIYGEANNWDVSLITDMSWLFYDTKFNEDISKWNVSNVTDMGYMFYGSQFNQDISNWNVSNVTDMRCMFQNSQFNGDISNWNVSNVTDMSYMFCRSQFDRDISKWNLNSNVKMKYMFRYNNLVKFPHWYR